MKSILWRHTFTLLERKEREEAQAIEEVEEMEEMVARMVLKEMSAIVLGRHVHTAQATPVRPVQFVS